MPNINNQCLPLICVAAAAFAARPFFTDDAGTVETGMHEFEAGLEYWSDNIALSFGFKHGLTDRMDMGIGFAHVMQPDEISGFTNIEMGVKYALISNMLSASAAVSPGAPGYALTAILSRAFGPIAFNLNAGYEVTPLTDNNGTLFYALGAVYEMNRFTLGLEAGGNEDNLDAWQIGGSAGIMTDVRIDLGLSGAFEDIENSLLLTAGLTYEF